MNFRSMTDEQILTKYGYDAEPWEATATLTARFDTEDAAIEYAKGGPVDYAPRPECIPSRDPEPWLVWSLNENLHQADEKSGRSWWRPRPEHKRPPVNPILANLRRDVMTNGWDEGMIAHHLNHATPESHDFPNATPDQIEHARKVLTRLAALS